MKKLTLGLVLALSMTGCSGFNMDATKQTLSFVTSAANLKYYYESGDVVNFIDSVELTDDEITRVITALEAIDKSKKTLKVFEDEPKMVITDMETVIYEYQKIKAAYGEIKSVVVTNFDDYKPKAKASFIEFDVAARTLDEQFKDMVDAVERNAALMTALRLADTAIKIAATL